MEGPGRASAALEARARVSHRRLHSGAGSRPRRLQCSADHASRHEFALALGFTGVDDEMLPLLRIRKATTRPRCGCCVHWPTRGVPPPSSTLGSCITTAAACARTTLKRRSGFTSLHQGDSPAQFNLGVMYSEGQGRAAYYAEAVKGTASPRTKATPKPSITSGSGTPRAVTLLVRTCA